MLAAAWEQHRESKRILFYIVNILVFFIVLWFQIRSYSTKKNVMHVHKHSLCVRIHTSHIYRYLYVLSALACIFVYNIFVLFLFRIIYL